MKKLRLPRPPIPDRILKERPPADGPLGGGRFTSPLHDTRNAAYLGMALGVAFTVCFIARLMEVCLRSEKSPSASLSVSDPQHLLHPIAHPAERARLTHQPHALQPTSPKR